jgi:nucleoside-diphosphate-sugar epimerase
VSHKTIGILGCGWLGYDLALRLKKLQYAVRGSSRTTATLQKLVDNGVAAFNIDLQQDKLYGDVQGFLEGLDVLIIDIPPGLRANPESDFAYRIKLIMKFVQVYEVKKVLFVSSTSVFEDQLDFPVYDENSIPNATNSNGKQLIAAEQLFIEMAQQPTIIRPCGLIGNDRHPVKFLAGKTGIKNPQAPVNLVTRDHVNDAIIKIIATSVSIPIFHAVSEPHENRKDYYEKVAITHQLPAPVFESNQQSLGKRIVSVIEL